jgi:ATP-dependent DNA helicase UvrD/PcrA
MPVAYLDKLNPEQRRAVEHGVGDGACVPAVPLLVIAGAGSGKTNTLAHRVAHLIVNRVGPRRILLMTFSRRAASEMTRHAGRICSRVLGTNADVMTDALADSTSRRTALGQSALPSTTASTNSYELLPHLSS